MRTRSRCAPFIDFLDALTKASGLVFQNADELLQGIVILNGLYRGVTS
jgi:hypothetical protein